MSGLFGSHAQSASIQRYNGIQISSSSTGGCIPLVYGYQRIPFNLVWYGNFTATAVQGPSAGKGGSGNNTTGYNYSAAFIAALAEGGGITGISQVWNDKDLTTLATLGFTFFFGNSGQATWSYLTTNFPSQAIPYDHIAYVATSKYNLGDSAAMPNLTFEFGGFLVSTAPQITFTAVPQAGAKSATLSTAVAAGTWNITFPDKEVVTATVAGNQVTWSTPLNNTQVNAFAQIGPYLDADAALVIQDYLTDPNHGVGFPAANVGTLTGANSFQSYCLALGLTISTNETSQRAASDYINEVLKMTNSDAVWSASTLNILPYADAPVSGNGYSYTPNLTPLYIFTDDDFLTAPDLKRTAIADTYNHVRVEYLDRSNEYNTAVVEATDLGNIAATGERVMDTLDYHQFTNAASALMSAQLALQTSLYERNTMIVKVRSDYCLLEPMDYIGICDPTKSDGSGLGYGSINNVGQETNSQVFRVTKVTDDDKDEIELELMEVLGTVRNAAVYNWAGVQGYNANFGVAPGSVQAPAFLEAYETLVGPAGGRELWIAVGGPSGSTAWGGCTVYLSYDNTTYTQIGTVSSAARYGTLATALAAVTDPDTTSTMEVLLNNTLATLTSGTQADADGDRILMAVGSGSTVEIISYETAALVTAGEYNITYLRRGQYGTTSQAHAVGAQVIRLDGNVLKLDMDPGYLGTPLYFKFTSYNMVGRATELLSAVTAYSYTPGQSTTAYNVISASTFLASGNAVVYSPTTAFKSSGGVALWDSSVYSTQSYLNGCTAECSPSVTNLNFMMGLCATPTTTAVNNYINLAYAFFCQSNTNLAIFEFGSQIALGAGINYAAGDLLAITYDGKHIAYYHNGILVRSVPVAITVPLFMQICFYDPGASVYGLSYDNQSPTSNTTTWVNFNANSAVVGNTVTKTSLNDAWDTAIYSLQGFANGCALSAQQQSTLSGSNDMIGLTTNPQYSVSYANLAYAWDLQAGNALIYESSVNIPGIALAYTNATLFEITYDGKHVCYYAAGSLIRSVPITGQTFYPQICLGNIKDVIGNLSWGPLTSSVTPFTLVPLTTGTAASGTKITSNTIQPQSQFGVRTWITSESYSNGCTCSGVATTGQAQFFGLSTGNSEYSSGAFWYPHTDVALTQGIFNGGNVFNIPNVASTDVLTIEYDTFYFYWFKNNTLIYQQYAPNVGPLYLYGDFFYQNNTWSNLSFAPNGALTPNPFIATGSCVVHDSSCLKNAGSSTAWDSGFYSINQYKICHVQFKIGNLLPLMIGLTTTPPPTSGNSSYTSISYAWYSTNAGFYQIYEGGAYVGNFGSGAPLVTDLLAVTYDGSNVRYYMNGALTRTVAVTGLTLSAMGSFYSPTAQASAISFGPGTTLDTVPTASIDPNATTDIHIYTVAQFTPTINQQTLFNLNVGPYPYATNIVMTGTGQWSVTVANSTPSAEMALVGNTATSGAVVSAPNSTTFNVGQTVTAGNTAAIQIAFEQTFSLAANTTGNIVVQVYTSATTSVAPSNSFTNVVAKFEVIKR